MPVSSDFSGDYKYFHGTRTVVHTHKGAAGDVPTTVPYALKQSVRVQDNAGAWIISATQCTWRLPGALTASDPIDGDTITDGPDVWTISGDAVKEPLTNLWECPCVKER
jgi:hypothetical protein